MRVLRSIGAALALSLCSSAVIAQTSANDPAGDWRTTINVGPSKLRLILHLGAQSTFDSPDQGANGLPAQMSVADGKVTVLLRGAGRFEGKVSADGKTLEGAILQGPSTIAVTFERGTFAAANRPQTPKPPFPYKAEEVSYDNPRQAGVHLTGTLTTPQGAGPFPVVLLITGSGTQDRDESLFEHKPFLVLADALTRRGIAVLRVDDRGIGKSGGGLPNPTTADFASDVETGVTWLRTRPDIDPKRIGLLGHSEGGLIAPMVAAKDPSVAFIVLWAGPGIPGKDVIIDQARTISLASGAAPEVALRNEALQRNLINALLAAPDREAAKTSMNAISVAGGGPAITEATVAVMSSPWYRYFMRLDPAVALKQVNVPTLALLGGKDTQVSPQANEATLRASLAHNKKAVVEVLPGLNHMFQMAKTGAPSEYGDIEQTLDPSALNRMVGWIAEVTKAKR